MEDEAYLKSVNDLPAYTKGAGKFMGNVGIGVPPKFPIFRLQVHQNSNEVTDHGAVLITDRSNRGLTLAQTKEGALLRSWNLDTKGHEALLVEASPLLIQPKTGTVLIGTTVKREGMQLHVKGNFYIHGHMFALRNMHVRDHASLDHLLMPSMSLKNQPQTPDGDTLVLGHMSKDMSGSQGVERGPWEDTSPSVVHGINLRMGYHQEYTWIQTHGQVSGGNRAPLALNPLGNTVGIGTEQPDKRFAMHANGNGYVLGTLYVKMKAAHTMEDARVTDYAELSSEDMTDDQAMQAMRQSKVRRRLLSETKEAQDELLSSRLAMIDVPEALSTAKGKDQVSVTRMTSMIHKVLQRQDKHMSSLDDLLERQVARIADLQRKLSK